MLSSSYTRFDSVVTVLPHVGRIAAPVGCCRRLLQVRLTVSPDRLWRNDGCAYRTERLFVFRNMPAGCAAGIQTYALDLGAHGLCRWRAVDQELLSAVQGNGVCTAQAFPLEMLRRASLLLKVWWPCVSVVGGFSWTRKCESCLSRSLAYAATPCGCLASTRCTVALV